MNLKKLQSDFADQILNSNNCQERIKIYRNNVLVNLLNVLSAVYPIVKNLVGDGYFSILVGKYCQEFPSKSGNLDEYGQHFSKLIGQIKNQHKIYYLKDIARLEWFFHQSYFTKDVTGFDLESFQKLKEEELFKVKFDLHPSCYLIESQYPIFDIWNVVKESGQKLDLSKREGQFVLVERVGLEVKIENLAECEFLFLNRVQKKQNLYQIYEEVGSKFPDFDIGKVMNRFISSGLVSDFK
ncbi:MAG: hypothetical protein ACJAW3_000451 [Lentimonas sp.]|jgi:hypothetical protein